MVQTETSSVKVANHPLVQQILTRIRDYQTPTGEFRQKALQLSKFLVYEAMSELSTREVGVQTPVGAAKGIALTDYLILAPVLRAGLILAEAAQELMPSARIYHVGLRRDEATLQAISYYAKLPEALPAESRVYVLDPMLATGGSAVAAISLFTDLKVQTIHLVSFVAAPEGIKRVHSKFPQVKITTASVDSNLNEHGYIVPGLGDAGDRIFGT
ncbi:MAG: uracil phosphoribosyltransferase [Candidatus Obscuribacterales bacterium]|nr:uracil phosphoribosyltransferase [Cyanobacteria bacterium SZAS LIN-5]RTL38823.1 MAG: uracil phosphoribosyltransferase [Candidatus Melainabacteria bacterium]